MRKVTVSSTQLSCFKNFLLYWRVFKCFSFMFICFGGAFQRHRICTIQIQIARLAANLFAPFMDIFFLKIKNSEEVIRWKSISWTRNLSGIPTFIHELLTKHLITDSSAKHAKPPNAHKHKKYGIVHFKRNTYSWLCWSVQAFTFPGICIIYQRHFIHNQTTNGWHRAQHKEPVKFHAVVSRKMVLQNICLIFL